MVHSFLQPGARANDKGTAAQSGNTGSSKRTQISDGSDDTVQTRKSSHSDQTKQTPERGNSVNAKTGGSGCAKHRRPLHYLPAVCAFLVLLAVVAWQLIQSPPDFLLTEDQRFVRFTDEVFAGELCGNTLNMHYSVARPDNYHIETDGATLGNASLAARQNACAVTENYYTSLQKFDRTKLSDQRRLTYDIFRDYLETELSASSLLLYDEPLSPTLGIQAQLPVLLAEYTFRIKGDIEDYLCLLSQVPDYFDSILSFEREKSAAGLFMSSDSALEVIRQCHEFIANPEENYLIELFDDKIDKISNLTADEKIAYKARNKSILTGYVIPAYEALISGIAALENTGTNDKGLCYFPEGRAYYEYLVKSTVGDSRPIETIEELIKTQMVADFSAVQDILQRSGSRTESQSADGMSGSNIQSIDSMSGSDSQSTAGTNGSGSQSATATNSPESQSGTAPQAASDPAAMLDDLRQKITNDFPLLPSVSCSVKYVHPSLEKYLSPAFYLTPAIDDYTDNVIYINPSSNYSGVELYTTLAHEGYPGHLYQSVYFNATQPDPLRCLLDVGGYTEGWATYVEMYAYSHWNGDPTSAALGQRNRSFTLGLASLLDIGIHYRGYSLDDVTAFLQKLGFSGDTAKSLYRSILEAPANYLKYYVGCLNFTALRDAAKERLGDRFSLKEFHRTVLDAGPAPFAILEREVNAALFPNAPQQAGTQLF